MNLLEELCDECPHCGEECAIKQSVGPGHLCFEIFCLDCPFNDILLEVYYGGTDDA